MTRTAERMLSFVVELDREESVLSTTPSGGPLWLLRQLVEQPIFGTPLTRAMRGPIIHELPWTDPEYLEEVMEALLDEPLGYQVWLEEEPGHVELVLSVPNLRKERS